MQDIVIENATPNFQKPTKFTLKQTLKKHIVNIVTLQKFDNLQNVPITNTQNANNGANHQLKKKINYVKHVHKKESLNLLKR